MSLALVTLGSINCRVCASKSLLVFESSWRSYSPPLISSPWFLLSGAQDHCLFTLSCHLPFRLVGHVFGKRPHDLSGSTLSKIPRFLCLHPTASLILLPTAQLSLVELVLISLEILPWMVCHSLPWKPFLFPSSSNDGAKSFPKLTPTEYFLSTLQKTPNKNAILKEVYFFFF